MAQRLETNFWDEFKHDALEPGYVFINAQYGHDDHTFWISWKLQPNEPVPSSTLCKDHRVECQLQ